MISPPRYTFLDLYRGVVVLMMLQGHVLRAALESASRSTEAFRWHELFHGITAPGFLFGAGFTFAVAAQRRWDELRTVNSAFFRRLARPLLLVALGYALHIPFLSLRKILEQGTEDQWAALFSFDALQCIGVSLFVARMLLVLLYDERLFLGASWALFMGIVFVTPVVWYGGPVLQAPLWLKSAISGASGSVFPLFPYAAYVFAGILVSWWYLRESERGKNRLFMKRLLLVGLACVVGGLVFDVLPVEVYQHSEFWTTSPNYFWVKLGILLILLSGLWFLDDVLGRTMPAWLMSVGVESLFVYVAHLLLLYGWVLNPEMNIADAWAGRLTWVESWAATALVIVVIVPVAMGWRYMKQSHPYFVRGVYWWIGFSFTYAFLFNPY